MSQSVDSDAEILRTEGQQALNDLGTMISRGRSWSGHERNCCFLNPGLGKGVRTHFPERPEGGFAQMSPDHFSEPEIQFANISALSGLDYPDDGRAIAVVDWDQDGDQDLWIANRTAPCVRFMRNETSRESHYLALRLEGNGRDTNRDAIGARVELVVKGGSERMVQGSDSIDTREPLAVDHFPMVKCLRAGEGYLAQSSKWLHFGLGAADAIEKVIVRWPAESDSNEAVEEFAGLEVDGRYTLVQSSGRPIRLPERNEGLALVRSPPKTLPSSSTARIPCTTLLPMKKWTINDARGRVIVETGAGKPVLLNLWASWCQPCIEELLRFQERAADLQKAGLQILALSVDALDGDRGNVAAAERFFRTRQMPFLSIPVSKPDVEMLQSYHDTLLGLDHPLPVPSSFLIDGKGRVSVIYKGPVPVDQLLADLDHSRRPWAERWLAAAGLPGQSVEHERIRQTAYQLQATNHLQHAVAATTQGWSDVAIADYRTVVRLHPDFALAHRRLGNLLYKREDYDQAAHSYRKAITLDAKDELAHNNLGLILENQGQLNKAFSHFRRAVDANPEYLPALRNVARSYASRAKWSDAAAYYERVLKIKSDDRNARVKLAQVLGSLAAAQADTGRYDEAVATAHKAVSTARIAQRPELVQEIESRLHLYQRNQPSRREKDQPTTSQ